MKTHEIRGIRGNSVILVGERLQRLIDRVPTDRLILITDENVAALYGHEFPTGAETIRIGTGEKIKTLETVASIYDRLLRLGADRSTFLVGIGGGIVCDISGFAACTYLRGLRFGFVSSTLLSQVDASVGGKNGVNFKGYKNMVGVFSQPEFVVCDLNLLPTLPPRELSNGFAEIIKHAVITDADLFAYLETNCQKALALDPVVIEKLVYDSVVIKSRIVGRDETETGERRKLNFGHTYGHAIEKVTGLSHGEAVSAGMVAAAALSVKTGRLSRESAKRLEQLLRDFRLPTRLPVEKALVADALEKDKKRQAVDIHTVYLTDIGCAEVVATPIRELKSHIDTLFDY